MLVNYHTMGDVSPTSAKLQKTSPMRCTARKSVRSRPKASNSKASNSTATDTQGARPSDTNQREKLGVVAPSTELVTSCPERVSLGLDKQHVADHETLDVPPTPMVCSSDTSFGDDPPELDMGDGPATHADDGSEVLGFPDGDSLSLKDSESQSAGDAMQQVECTADAEQSRELIPETARDPEACDDKQAKERRFFESQGDVFTPLAISTPNQEKELSKPGNKRRRIDEETDSEERFDFTKSKKGATIARSKARKRTQSNSSRRKPGLPKHWPSETSFSSANVWVEPRNATNSITTLSFEEILKLRRPMKAKGVEILQHKFLSDKTGCQQYGLFATRDFNPDEHSPGFNYCIVGAYAGTISVQSDECTILSMRVC